MNVRSGQENNLWDKLVNMGQISIVDSELPILERQLVESLVPEDQIAEISRLQFLDGTIRKAAVPRDFLGKITGISVKLLPEPVSDLLSLTPIVARNLVSAEELEIITSCSSTGYGSVGQTVTRAWYYEVRGGKWHLPYAQPIRRKVLKPSWSEGSVYPDIMKRAKRTAGLGEASGRTRNNVNRQQPSGDTGQRWES